jgi:CheY-like chemotaxis protein
MNPKNIILIADDEPNWRELIESLLRNTEYTLEFAEDGQETLDKARKLMPDLILMDVTMPVMNGFEATRRLRQDSILAEVPIVMVTSLDDRASRIQGIEAGVDDFLNKPFDGVELRARVTTIIKLNRYRRLIAERTRFEWVVERAFDGYLMLTDDDHLVYANPQARIYLELPLEDDTVPTETFLELAKKYYNLEPEEGWADWPAPPSDSFQAPLYLVRPESASSNILWLQANILDVPDGSQANRMVQLRDITSQVVLKRDTWKFHSMVLHKLRTPLGVMLTSLELLADTAPSLPTSRIVEMANVALRGVQRLRSEIKDITDYLTAPTMAVAGQELSLSRVREMVLDVCKTLDIRSVNFATSTLADLHIRLSEQATEMVLQQILENSKKFHPLNTPRVLVGFFQPDPKHLTIRIADDGLSLSPAQVSQAFTPYYQGEKYFTGETEGMGLGLATVATIVWSVGGRCRMYNRPDGPGVVVELTLPTTDG